MGALPHQQSCSFFFNYSLIFIQISSQPPTPPPPQHALFHLLKKNNSKCRTCTASFTAGLCEHPQHKYPFIAVKVT